MSALPSWILPALTAICVAVIAAQIMVLAWLLLCLWELQQAKQEEQEERGERRTEQ